MGYKTLWKEGPKGGYFFLCPHCRTERRLPRKPTPGTKMDFFQIALATAFATLLTWHWLEWKGAFAFVPLWIVYEMAFRTRMRAKLRCDGCGFDPLLYLVDVQKAREEIREHWKKKFAEKGLEFPNHAPQEKPPTSTDIPA